MTNGRAGAFELASTNDQTSGGIQDHDGIKTSDDMLYKTALQ